MAKNLSRASDHNPEFIAAVKDMAKSLGLIVVNPDGRKHTWMIGDTVGGPTKAYDLTLREARIWLKGALWGNIPKRIRG